MAITVRSLSELNNYVNSLGTTKRIRLETATAKDIGTTASDIEWDTQDYIDSDVFTHSTSTSNTEVTVEVAGLYTIELNAAHNNTGGARATVYTKIQVNNVDVPGSYDSQYSRGTAYSTNLSTDCSVTLQLAADDVITIEAGVEDSEAVYVIDRIPAECILHIMSIGAAGASNTWRDIDNTPVNASTDTSISSDWAYKVENETMTIGGIKTFSQAPLAPTKTTGNDTTAVATTEFVQQEIAASGGGGATGSGSDEIFYENDTIVTESYTLTANKNAMSAGPITVGFAGVSISNIDGDASQITVTTSAVHGLVATDKVDITGKTNYNGNYTVASVTSTTIYVITDAAHNLPAETGGTSTKEVIVTIPNGSTWVVV